MIERFGILVMLVLTCLSVVPGGACSATDDVLPADLQAAINAFYTAIESDDVETRIGLLADNVVMMPNHWTMVRGKGAVSASFRRSAGSVFRLRERTMDYAAVSGDMAYTVNSYGYTYHAKDSSPQWHKTKNVHVWRRTSAGDWRLEVDIWNSDVPVADFKNENKQESSDESLIQGAVEKLYLKGLKTRDFDLIRNICIPETVLMSRGSKGQLNLTTLDKWSERFDPDNPPFESLECSMVSVDVEGSAAQVRILFIVDGERRVTDFLNMLKLDNRWRIVHIIDYSDSRQ